MCKCVNVEMGSYVRQTTMINPFNNKQVDIDTCLVQEIAELWKAGIQTIECCCGHNKTDGYIAVKYNPENIEKMNSLGYRDYPHPDLEAIYYPIGALENKHHINNKELINKLIKSIHINKANFDYCSETLKINGTLYSEIERVMLEYKNYIPEELASKLKNINKELFFKFGPESYEIRCKLSDIYNPIKE